MRVKLLVVMLVLPLFLSAQKKGTNLVTIFFEDETLEIIFDSLSYQSGYFFSYNSEIFPKGSRYSISVKDQPIDKVLSQLLVGTGLKYTFFKDQIILNYEAPSQQSAQRKKFFTISGKLLDEDSEPLIGANVFLDGTSLGNYTDSNGNYYIESVPPGYYDLVFSHIGYVNGVYQLSEYNGGSRIQNHKFVVDLGKLQEVEVVSDRITRNGNESDWVVYYNDFKSELLGLSSFSRECTIENPEVINFYFNESIQQLIAYADEPIIIRNDALGYRINYFLESFKKKENDLRFRGKIRFNNQQPINNQEKRKWRKNRKKSYLGSFNHFKKSLLVGDTEKEGFKMYRSKGNIQVSKSDRLFDVDLIVYKGDHYELKFQDNLVVEYSKESESIDFLVSSDFAKNMYDSARTNGGEFRVNPGNQISIIRLLRGPVKIDLTGQIVDKFALTIYGYMSWERTADLVPLNYDPKWDKF